MALWKRHAGSSGPPEFSLQPRRLRRADAGSSEDLHWGVPAESAGWGSGGIDSWTVVSKGGTQAGWSQASSVLGTLCGFGPVTS